MGNLQTNNRQHSTLQRGGPRGDLIACPEEVEQNIVKSGDEKTQLQIGRSRSRRL